jgi:hypothetical protein
MDIMIKSSNKNSNNRAMMLRIISYHPNHRRRVRHEQTALITIIIIVMLLRRIPEQALRLIQDQRPPLIPDRTTVPFPIRHQCRLERIAPDLE